MATPLAQRLFGLRLHEEVADNVEYVVERLRAASPERRRPVIVGQVTDRITDAHYLFETNDLHHLPVVSGRHVVGIVSTTDLLRFYSNGAALDPEEAYLQDIMTPQPEVIEKAAPIQKLIGILAHSSFRCLPVLDTDGELWDIVTTRDLVRFLELVYR